MTFSALSDLNWPAVIVSAIVYYAVGAVWFTPIAFGKPWMRSIGWDPGAEPPKMNAAMVAGPLVAYLLAAIALGMVAELTGTDTVGEGIVLGLVAGIGLAGSIVFVTAVFDPQKPERVVWFAITGAYHLVGMLVSSVILAVWR